MKKTLAVALVAATCLSTIFGAHAADPSPSHPVPSFVVEKDADGNEFVAELVKNYDGKTYDVVRKLPKDQATITALADKDSANATIKANLEAAEKEVKAAGNDLTSLNADLEKVAKELVPGYETYEYIPGELFDMSIATDSAKELNDNKDVYLHVKLDTGIEKGVVAPVIMHRSEVSGQWEIVPVADVKNLDDGTMEIFMNDTCPMLFITIKGSKASSPDTGVTTPILVVAIVSLAAVSVVATRKKRAK